jgi:hypothetical protein
MHSIPSNHTYIVLRRFRGDNRPTTAYATGVGCNESNTANNIDTAHDNHSPIAPRCANATNTPTALHSKAQGRGNAAHPGFRPHSSRLPQRGWTTTSRTGGWLDYLCLLSTNSGEILRKPPKRFLPPFLFPRRLCKKYELELDERYAWD